VLLFIDEFAEQTHPKDYDTDDDGFNDGLPDGWEADNGCNPLNDFDGGTPDAKLTKTTAQGVEQRVLYLGPGLRGIYTPPPTPLGRTIPLIYRR
jgi:hypothetical protein